MYASVSTLYNFSWKIYGLREGWVQKLQSIICAVFSVVCIGVLDQGGHVTINLSPGLIDQCTLENTVQKRNFETLDSTLKIQIAKYTNTYVPNTRFCASIRLIIHLGSWQNNKDSFCVHKTNFEKLALDDPRISDSNIYMGTYEYIGVYIGT